MRILSLAIIVFTGLSVCSQLQCRNSSNISAIQPIVSDSQSLKPMKYLALGDSYTIGESVNIHQNYPNQLRDSLVAHGLLMNPVEIIATTGWTTNDLQNAIHANKPFVKFDLVTLLIGVNNQYRGYNIDIYKKEFEELLIQAIDFADGDTNHVFVLSIPDYGYTPFGASNKSKISIDIDKYNEIAKEICAQNAIPFFDITPISRRAEVQPDLIANDGLHPSGIMYTEWVKLIQKDIYLKISH